MLERKRGGTSTSRNALSPLDPRDWTVAGKLWVGFGLLILVMALGGAVAYRQILHIEKAVIQVVEVEEPLEQAILEIEINATETARAVLDYVHELKPETIDRIRDSEADFERFAAQFDRLAETAEERRLGRRVAELYREFKGLGDEIIALADRRRDALETFRKNVREIDELIDEKLQVSIDRTAPDAITKLEAALDMEINIDEAFAAIQGYIAQADPALRQEVLDAEADFRRFEALYRQTSLSADEETWLDRIDRDFAEAVEAGNRIMATSDRLRESLHKFEADLYAMDTILDDRIQPLIHAETVRAAEGAKTATNTAALLLLALGAAGVAIGSALAWALSRGIIGPIGILARGAEIVGGGNLEHRIDIAGNDEFAKLSGAFNRMAENLGRDMAARERAEEALRKAHEDLELRVTERTRELTEEVAERKRAKKELRVSEQNYRALFENAAAGIGRSRITDGKVLLANRKLAQVFGYERVEQFVAEFSFVDHYVDPGERERLIALYKDGSDNTVEVSFTTRDGSVVTVANQGWVDEKAGHIDFVMTDITERKGAEKELRLRNQELLTLHRISEISLQPHALTEAFQSIVDVISKATNFPNVSIELYDRKFNAAAHSPMEGVRVRSGGDSRGVPMEDTFCCSIVRSGGPMRKVPATNGSGRARKLKRHKMETIIPVPMIIGDTVVGVLTLAHPEKIKLEGRLPKWAATLANYIAALTDRMRAEEVLHKRVDLYRELSKRIETAGATSLHDHELMELLLLLTAPRNDAAALTERLMSGLGGFAEAINAEPRAIKEIHGGDEAIVAFAAVREAAIRLAREELTKRPVFDSWDKLITYCRIGMAHEKTEHFRVLYLNRSNILIADEIGQKGTVDQTPFYPREVVKRALELSATALILVHNHPSGDPTPSGDDIEVTKDVTEAAEKLGIVLHDHIIVSKSTHCSFRSMGLM